MTIQEMQAWLNEVEPGPVNCALRESFELCLQDQATVNTLAMLIEPLHGTDEAAYLMSLGHFVAFASLNKMLETKALRLARAETSRVQ